MDVKRPTFEPAGQGDRGAFNPFMDPVPDDTLAGPFRIGELSRVSGVPIGTIKFYLRERLIPPGQATAKTQALYGPEHLRRLRLVRVLADVGRLSIAQMRRVAAVLDEGDDEPGELERVVSYALGNSAGGAEPVAAGQAAPAPDDAVAAARRDADAFVAELGFEVDPHAPARGELADALHALRVLGIADDPRIFTEHARLAYELGEFEIDSVDPLTDRAAAAEAITVGSVVFGAAFMALRRMAHEHEVRRRLAAADAAQAPPLAQASPDRA